MLEFKLTLYTVLLIGIPVGISVLLLWFMRKRGVAPKYRWLAVLPMLYVAYGVYTGLTEPYSLYQQHFEEITGRELPEQSEFIDRTDWGYGSKPRDNNSLFYVKVEPEFYEQLKQQLKPSAEPLPPLHEDYRYRFEAMFGKDFAERLDFHASDYNSHGELRYIVGFFEAEHSLLVFSWQE